MRLLPVLLAGLIALLHVSTASLAELPVSEVGLSSTLPEQPQPAAAVTEESDVPAPAADVSADETIEAPSAKSEEGAEYLVLQEPAAGAPGEPAEPAEGSPSDRVLPGPKQPVSPCCQPVPCCEKKVRCCRSRCGLFRRRCG